jgi:hypothetical protein
MKPVIIIAITFVLLVPTSAFAVDGYFESDYGKVLSHEPTICLFQPDDIRIDDKKWKNYVIEMKNGIYSWNSALNVFAGGDWTLNIVEVPLDKLSRLNYYQCDIPVTFTRDTHSTSSNALGWASPTYGDIWLKYERYEFCGTEYNSQFKITVNTLCFSKELERPKYVASVLQHEIGHTLGLGHYIGYDPVKTQQWYDHGIGMPSIMTHQTSNEELKTITKVDVDKIYEFYGQKGFGKKTDLTPMFNDPIIPERVIPVAGVINLHITGNSVQKMITGYIPDTLYKRGEHLEIEIQKPNGFTESKITTVSKNLHSFKHNLTFNQSSQEGWYTILLRFDGTVFEKIPINLSKSSVSSNYASNSISGKYLENIIIKENSNKYTVTSQFSSNYASNQIRIIAENECPFKKQVFRQDFRFDTGKPISFSFSQSNIGKPSVCTIHFTVTNFEGHVLDSIKAEYNPQIKQQNISSSKTTSFVNEKNDNPTFTDVQKQKIAKKIDTSSVSMLKLKDGLDVSWKYLKDADKKYTDSQSKKYVEKAWTVYNKLYDERITSMKTLDTLVKNYLDLEFKQKTSNWNYYDQYMRNLKTINSEITSIGNDMKYISQELENAKKIQNEENQKHEKQCSWFWC